MLEWSAAIAAIAFTILVAYLILTLRRVMNTLDETKKTLGKRPLYLSPCSNKPTGNLQQPITMHKKNTTVGYCRKDGHENQYP
ncbi:uncharacterized protein DUF948 [Bacillus sp. V-88]|nr:uncharacterized protein DUF948 [Bacillus sp. V-88]SLK25064.1 protein of unknown function [Bacillus sp. V-88]